MNIFVYSSMPSYQLREFAERAFRKVSGEALAFRFSVDSTRCDLPYVLVVPSDFEFRSDDAPRTDANQAAILAECSAVALQGAYEPSDDMSRMSAYLGSVLLIRGGSADCAYHATTADGLLRCLDRLRTEELEFVFSVCVKRSCFSESASAEFQGKVRISHVEKDLEGSVPSRYADDPVGAFLYVLDWSDSGLAHAATQFRLRLIRILSGIGCVAERSLN